MKKSFLLILCLLLTIALVACATDDNNGNEDTTAADKVTTAEVTTAGDEETSEDTSSEITTNGEETTTEEEETTECVHELSDEIVGLAAGHYHLTNCEHDLVLDLVAHTGTEDGVCDDCEYSFADLIDEITAPEAGEKINGGTVIYNGQYENREASFQIGNGFLYIDENVEYTYDPGVITNTKHSVHLLENGNVFYVKDSNDMLTRESYDITENNVKGYAYSSDMYDYLALEFIPCGTEDLLYAFYTYAKANFANNLTTTWGETNNITFKTGDDWSAKVYSIDFAINENGVITSLSLSYVKYYGPDLDDLGEPVPETVKYTIDDNGVVTIVDGAEVDATISIQITQTEGERTAVTTYNVDEMLVDSYEITLDGAAIGDTLPVEVGSKTTLTISGIAPESANLDLDNILASVVDENGEDTWSINAYVSGNSISISAYQAGNYVVTLTSLNVTKTFAVVVTRPATTEIYAAVENDWGEKEAISSKDIYTDAAFEFVGLAQNNYADATFTAVITEGPEGATLTELDTADGYSFTATVAGTYVVTITSKANPDVTNTLTINVTEAPNAGDNFKGVWENTTYGFKVEINPTDATTGSYVVTMNGENYQYTYKLNGTTIDAVQVSGGQCAFVLQFNSSLGLELANPKYGTSFALTQTSTGDEGGDEVGGFEGTYSGIVDNMGVQTSVTVVAGPESFDLTMDGATTTYYYTMGEDGNLTVVPNGSAPADFAFRYVADMDMLTVELYNSKTGMYVEVGALAKAAGGDDAGDSIIIEGTFNGVCPDYYNTEFTVTFDGNTMYIKDENMGGEVAYTYTVNEYGELTLTYVSGEEMVIMGLQFVYYADTEILVVNRENMMTGMYTWVGELEKQAAASVAIDGVFTGECPDYYSTVFTVTFEGDTVHIKDENMGGEVTYTYTVDDYGTLILTYVSGEEMVIMDLQFVYYADTEILVVNRYNQMTGMYVWVGELAKAPAAAGTIEGTFNGVCPDYYNTEFTVTFNGDVVTIKDENMGGEVTFTYTVNEYGELTLTYVSGEEMVVMDLQFVYYADDNILVVNRLNQMTGTYVYVGELAPEGEETGVNIEGQWSSVDGAYLVTFTPSEGAGTIDFSDKETGEWLKIRGFTYTLSEDGIITFTSIKGNLSGFMDWSTNSYAVVSGEFITLVLDSGETVLLQPRSM